MEGCEQPGVLPPLPQMLVFSQFTMMLDILEDYLDLRKLTYSRLDGAMPFVERERQVRSGEGGPSRTTKLYDSVLPKRR